MSQISHAKPAQTKISGVGEVWMSAMLFAVTEANA
jgi:hypothetical protein